MKILVLVKQVADMESHFTVDDAGAWIDERNLAFRMNEYDEFAAEQALLVKEQLSGDADITVLSLGPPRVTEAIKKALAMGGDRGVHILDAAPHQKDPWQVAAAVHAFARDKDFDLVFTGYQSQDRGSAQVGPLLAELLGYPCLTTVVDFALADGSVTVRRELEGGVKGVLRASLPLVVTCQLGVNKPRYPTLPNIMKAKKKELLTFPVADLLAEEARAVTERLYRPEKRASGLILEGNTAQVVERLAQILKEKRP